MKRYAARGKHNYCQGTKNMPDADCREGMGGRDTLIRPLSKKLVWFVSVVVSKQALKQV